MRLAALGGKSASQQPVKPASSRFGVPLWIAFTAPVGLLMILGLVAALVGSIRSRTAVPTPPPAPVAAKVDSSKQARAAAKPALRPTPMPVPPTPTPMPAAPKPTPLPVAPPVLPERTVALDISEMKNEIAALPLSATVATEWFGMIVFTEGKLSGQSFTIDPENGFYIGRDRDLAAVVIEDSRISRRHCWVGVKDGKAVVVDQKSTNGTYVGTTKSRITEAELKDGMVVIMGENAASFRYQP